MRIFSILIVIILLGFYSLAKPNSNGKTADPNPTVPEYKPDEKKKKEKPTEQPLPPIPTPNKSIVAELADFETGKAIHYGTGQFCENLTMEIKNYIGTNKEVEKVIVKGFADGFTNRGLKKFDLAPFPSSCQKGVDLPIDDTELAILRGCVVFEKITELLGFDFAGGITWQKDKYDEPDGGNKGGLYRKVRVEIFLKKMRGKYDRKNR